MPKTRLAFARPDSLRAAPIVQLLLIAALSMGVGVAGRHAHNGPKAVDEASVVPTAAQQVLSQIDQSSPAQALATAGTAVASAIAPTPVSTAREVELDDGESFSELLTNQGISQADALAATEALSKVYDAHKMHSGQNITLSFLRTGTQETFTGLVFQPEDVKEISVLRKAEGGFMADAKLIPITRQRFAAQGEIRSSLYEAGDRSGVPHAIMAALIHTYSHDVDFQRDIHGGDSFEVLYDQPTTAKGKPIGEGTIVYAALHIGGKVKPIYRVTFSDNSVDYFDESGHSIRRTLLRTPVAAARITSGFGMRMHPILGYSKMHKGVDFGAPTGAPIFAAGNGTVVDIGFKGAYGRYICIRHNGTLETAYAHMSRFNSNLYRGAHVEQGQVIGFVGMSGRATGPHLHFEVHVNGQQVNPMSVNLPTGRMLDGRLLTAFKQGQGRMKQEFSELLAKNPTSQHADQPRPDQQPKGLIPASTTTVAYPAKTTGKL